MSGRSSAGTRGRSGRLFRGGRSITRGSGRGGAPVHRISDYTGDDHGHSEEDDGFEGLDVTDDEMEIGSPRSVTHYGSNASGTVPTHPSHKVWISLTRDNSSFTNHKAVTSITKNLKSMFNGPWATWSDVEAKHKDRLFAEFQGEFEWDPKIHTPIKRLWEYINGIRLSDTLSTERSRAINKVCSLKGIEDVDDLTDIIPHGPPWIKQQFWKKLVIEKWNTEAWKKISRTNKANRGKARGGLHTAGSGGYIRKREIFEELMGGPQPSSEVFKNNHIKKGTGVAGVEPEWVDERSRITYKTYTESLLEKCGPNVENHPKHDHELWVKAAGPRKKGRGYGSSKSLDPCFVLTGLPSTPSCGSSSVVHQQDEVQKLTQKIDEIQEEREKEKEEMLKEKEDMLKEKQEMQEREERLLRELHESKEEMKVREERLKKEVNDSKALVEGVRKEFSEKFDNLVKYLPNFPMP